MPDFSPERLAEVAATRNQAIELAKVLTYIMEIAEPDGHTRLVACVYLLVSTEVLLRKQGVSNEAARKSLTDVVLSTLDEVERARKLI